MKTITLAIADDYKIFRYGLNLCFNADENLKVLFETDDGEDLIKELANQQPDIVMDLNMPLFDGMEATKIIRKNMKQ